MTTEVAAEQLTSGFLSACSDDASLRLYVLAKEDFDSLQGSSEDPAESDVSEPVRIFLSYTHTSEEHRKWVRELATFLRMNGIESRLDQWHLHEGMDMVQWMCNELDLADRVLLICNEEYAKRADRRHGGVGWEVKIMQGDLYSAPPESDKYLPIVCCENPDDGLPAFLKTSLFVHWPPAAEGFEQRKRILESIYRVQEEPPPIGKPPAFVLGHRGPAQRTGSSLP